MNSIFYNKRGQDGSMAGIALIVITVLLVMYILFLPEDDRAILLEQEVNNDNGVSTGPVKEMLLRERVGYLDYVSGDEMRYYLNSFTLRAVSSSEVLMQQRNFVVKNTVFDTTFRNFRFDADSTAEDVMLTFNVDDSAGELIIRLNGDVIFQGFISEGNSPPIYINERDLMNSNDLSFEVTSPGLAFWRSHEYEISNLQVIGRIVDLRQSDTVQRFDIRSRDFDRFETVRLRFLPSCGSDVKGLTVKANNNLLFRGSPDCNIFNIISVPNHYLSPGVNEFEFEISEGEIVMDRLELITRLDIPDNPVYYFEVDEKHFHDNETIKDDAYINIRFTNPDRKRLELFINGRIIGITTQEVDFERNIKGYLQPGSNSLEIRPRQSVHINEVSIFLR